MSDGTFLLCVSGQLEWIDIFATAGTSWHCKYEFFFGADWKVIGGLEAGMSQVANVVDNGDKVVLNLPIEIQFKSTNPYGWPQIILSVYKGMQLAGYGRSHMPLKPGSHTVNAHLAKPQASSMLGHIASFFGYQPELLQPKMLATTAGNNLIQMEEAGHAQMTVNVVTQGFQGLGYDIGTSKYRN
nr:B9 domain-containing protein 1 [Leptinotarsa decemlineata]